MKIIHLAAELSPLAKAGGLGDVLQGLAGELAAQGHDVEVIIPAYPNLQTPSLPYKVTLLETPGFDRPEIYGYEDDAERFVRFTQKACAYIKTQTADIVHAHDWHTALAAALLPNVALTVHNLAYVGTCSPELLENVGLKLLPLYRGSEGFSLLRIGLVHAKKINTVSPTYAKEILTQEQAGPFYELLQASHNKLIGILNGIDTHYWNPSTDLHLPLHYSASQPEKKIETQRLLRLEFGLPPHDGPIVAAITRLVWQKGPELIHAAIETTTKLKGTFVLLASAVDAKMKETFLKLKSPSTIIDLHFDEKRSHKVYALADLMLVPSRYEPCGLTQLIAMRYGTLPLVRRTGGLVDTVRDGENGFVFGPYEETACCKKLSEAIELWHKQPAEWRRRQERAMQGDYSWKQATSAYLALYRSLLTTV